MFNVNNYLLALALWLAFVLALMLSCDAPAQQGAGGRATPPTQLHTYEASVVRVVDGDTIDVCMGSQARPCPVAQRRRVRIDGIDAPEFHGKCARETELAGWSLLYLVKILPVGTPVEVRVRKIEKYGRDLASVVAMHDGAWIDVGAHLVAMNHARPWDYPHQPKPDWCGARTLTIE